MTGAWAVGAGAVGWAGALVGLGGVLGLRGLAPGGRREVALAAAFGIVGLGAAAAAPSGLALGLTLGLPLAVVASLARSALGRLDPDRPFREAEVRVGEGRWRLGPARARLGVVVLHGGGNDRFYGLWYLYDRLLALGAVVEMVDLPGHGREGADIFSVAAGRARVDAAVASVAADTDRVVILGQSLGGAFALDAAARGTRADAVVSVSAPYTLALGPTMLREARALAGEGLWRTLRYGTTAEILPAVGSFRRAHFPIRGAGADYVATFRAALAEMDLLATLAGARVPLLVAHGTWDGVIGPVQAERIASAAPGARLLPLPGRTHLDPLLDRAAVDTLLAWLADPRSAPEAS
jgi:pimeloyl-ACP methyl ester carboxylesterase